MESEWRLDRWLAKAGVGSRKDVKKLLKKKRVKQNGQVVTDASAKVHIEQDTITLDGNPITANTGPIYLLMNKQKNRVSATTDAENVTVLADVEEQFRADLFPVGRLDKDTEGLLLLTNDGDFAHRLTSPKYEIEKEYEVTLDELPADEELQALEKGIQLKDGTVTKPAKLQWDDESDKPNVTITLTEGKYHQVKRMFGALGRRVTELKRIRIGSLSLDEDLKPGEYRELTTDELKNLFRYIH
ncbi:pseudouridine synthase [Geomicrobium sp. JSM 1781026]|uniref:pseudouridine synthase n=1 Tax=Geomicrobium sp. JSM 1781026 TaxID=3344580 RepID=UPI0035C1B82A